MEVANRSIHGLVQSANVDDAILHGLIAQQFGPCVAKLDWPSEASRHFVRPQVHVVDLEPRRRQYYYAGWPCRSREANKYQNEIMLDALKAVGYSRPKIVDNLHWDVGRVDDA